MLCIGGSMYHQYYLSQILDLQNTFMQKVTICNSPLSTTMLIRSKWTTSTQTNNTVALLSSVCTIILWERPQRLDACSSLR